MASRWRLSTSSYLSTFLRISALRPSTCDWALRMARLTTLDSIAKATGVARLPSWVGYSTHPAYDAYWQSKAIGASAAKIDVPVLNCTTWQDDEVGSRPAWTLFPRIRPSLLWFIGSNGYHAGCEVSNTLIQDQVVRFFNRFVRGAQNGFESTPRVQIWHEAHQTTKGSATVNVPSWVSTFSAWPPTTKPTARYLRSGGLLGSNRPASDEAGETYLSPAPSAGTEEGIVFGQSHLMWDKPVPPGGALAWTTKPLPHDVETLGPASADLWLSSTSAFIPVDCRSPELSRECSSMFLTIASARRPC